MFMQNNEMVGKKRKFFVRMMLADDFFSLFLNSFLRYLFTASYFSPYTLLNIIFTKKKKKTFLLSLT